ncbi:hypothetical protein Tco_0778431 [Tanacetum coccineum]
MHQFWNPIKKIKDTDAYRFNLDKKKFRVDTEVFCEILQICPRLHNQDFVEPPSEEEMVSFIQELGYFGKCDMLSAIHTDHMHQPWRTFVSIINRCISGKSLGLDRLKLSTAQILWDMYNKNNVDFMYGALIPNEMINQDIIDSKSYKIYLDFATGKATPKKARKFKKVASPSKKLSPVLKEEPTDKPKDTPGVSVSKKKAPTKVDRGKGMDSLSEAALLKAAQLNKTLKKSKLETHKLHESGSDEGTGTKPGVPDVPKYQSESENESWGDSDDDDSNDVSNDDDVDSDARGDKEASDSQKTDSDEDENPNLNQNNDEEEEYEEEYVRTPDSYEFTDDEEYKELYKDVNARLKDKTEVPLQSSSISSDFANQFLNLDNAPPVDNEVVSMMNVKVRHEEPSTQIPSLLTIPVTAILETSTAATPTIPPTISLINPLLQQSKPTPTPAPTTTITTTSIHHFHIFIPIWIRSKSKRLEDSIQKAFRSYTAKFEKKAKYERKRYMNLVEKSVKDIIKDEVKSQIPQILPKEVSEFATPRDREDKGKDEDPPVGLYQGLKKRKTSKDAETSKGSKSKESKSSSSKGTKYQPKSFDHLRLGSAKLPKQKNHFSLSNNPEGQEYLVDLNKPLPLIEDQGRQVVPVNYFINNVLEYLKGGRYLEEIIVQKEYQKLYKFKEGDFRRLNMRDIEDMLLLLVQKKLSNLERDVIFDLNVALQMPETFRTGISKRTPYTAYNNPQGIIYVEKFKRNRLMRSDELYKYSDGTLTSVRSVLHDIASNLRMVYFPKRR